MKTYIATFFSHYGAMKFSRACTRSGIASTLMPVPRYLSSSCGTCCKYEVANDHNGFPPLPGESPELYQNFDLESISDFRDE